MTGYSRSLLPGVPAAVEDLQAFLFARLLEEEQDARRADTDGVAEVYSSSHQARWWPNRVLAEVHAKRLIVQEHERTRVGGVASGTCSRCGDGTVAYPCRTLRLLALPYADQPTYQEQWRPRLLRG